MFRQLDLLVKYAKLVQLGPPQRSLDELKQQLAKRNAAAHAARIAMFRHAEEPYARGIIRPEEGKLLAWLTTFFGGQLSEARLTDLAGYIGQQSSVGRQMHMADVAGMLAADSDVAVVSVQMASPLELVLEIPAALWLPFGFGFLALAERIATMQVRIARKPSRSC